MLFVTGSGEVEIEWAIKRASIDAESERVLNKAGDLMAQLDQYMQQKNMRVIDLFNALDTAQTGSVTSSQFRDGLVTIFGVRTLETGYLTCVSTFND